MSTEPTPTPECEDWNAYWCANHGDCICERAWDGDCQFDNLRCPLHGPDSTHAQAPRPRQEIAEFLAGLSDEKAIELWGKLRAMASEPTKEPDHG